MEEEQKKLLEMQGEVDKELQSSNQTGKSSGAGQSFPTAEEKQEIDARSIYVGNVCGFIVILSTCRVVFEAANTATSAYVCILLDHLCMYVRNTLIINEICKPQCEDSGDPASSTWQSTGAVLKFLVYVLSKECAFVASDPVTLFRKSLPVVEACWVAGTVFHLP